MVKKLKDEFLEKCGTVMRLEFFIDNASFLFINKKFHNKNERVFYKTNVELENINIDGITLNE